MTILLDKMPRKVACGFTIFWDVVALVLYVWVSFFGVKYIGYMAGSKTSVLRIDQGLTTSIVAFSGILNCYRIIEKMVKVHIPSFKEAK